MQGTASQIGVCSIRKTTGFGYFNIQRAVQKERPIRVELGTELGAGTSFSILTTLNESYKAAQLNGYALSACHA